MVLTALYNENSKFTDRKTAPTPTVFRHLNGFGAMSAIDADTVEHSHYHGPLPSSVCSEHHSWYWRCWANDYPSKYVSETSYEIRSVRRLSECR